MTFESNISADGFINGLAAVTQDALELSSSDVFLLAVVYDPKSGGKGKGGKKKRKHEFGVRLQSKLLLEDEEKKKMEKRNNFVMEAEAWKGGERALKLRRLRAAFDKKDIDGNGYLEESEIFKALAKSGVIASEVSSPTSTVSIRLVCNALSHSFTLQHKYQTSILGCHEIAH